MGKRIYLLIKVFDKEEYADAFIKSGEMFCKTIGQFKGIEGDEARGDEFEAVTDWHQPDQVSMTLSYKTPDGEEKSFPLEGLAGPVVMQNKGHDRQNVYCMYAVTVPEFEESYETEEQRLAVVAKINAMLKVHATMSEEMLSLGEYAVAVFRVEDFIDKVKQAANADGYKSWRGLVEYFDPETFHGSFDVVKAVFRKRDIYSYQNEFRFVFDSRKPEGAMKLRAGPLGGIAFKLKTREINEKLELKLAEDQHTDSGTSESENASTSEV